MPSSSRELQVYPCIPRLTECFGAGSSEGNFLVPARKLISKRAQGALPKSRPLENPPAALTNRVRFFRLAMGGSVENSLKDTLSLRTSGAPRSESKITMTASGSHTLIYAHWCGPFQGFPPVTIPRYFREL